MAEIQSPPIWLEESGKEILYINYKFLSHSQIIKQFTHAIEMGSEKGGSLLVLSNFESVPINKLVIDQLKVLAAEAVKKQDVKSAVLGITGIKRFLITIYSQFSKDVPAVFSSHEEAVAYLIED